MESVALGIFLVLVVWFGVVGDDDDDGFRISGALVGVGCRWEV